MVYPIRRAQLIAPFGTGAMSISKNGLSAICSGLDHWFKDKNGTFEKVDLSEFKIKEWRLERLLGVDHFRLPPDFRYRGESEKNKFLTVPFLRFPQWHYCTFCGEMKKTELTTKSREECPSCKEKNVKRYMVQVPFIAICEKGHIQDFPWREWVHHELSPSCNAKMKLISTGGGALTTMQVKCSCGKSRLLNGITTAHPDGTTDLSKELIGDGMIFTCQGKKPWLGTEEGEPCDCHLRGSLRSASNVYFAQVKSAIYIPGEANKQINQLVTMFRTNQFERLINLTKLGNLSFEKTIIELRTQFPTELQSYTDNEIKRALIAMEQNEDERAGIVNEEFDLERILRLEEYSVLSEPTEQEELKIRHVPIEKYDKQIFQLEKYFSDVFLVERLKETRVLAGFNRVFNDQPRDYLELKHHMWRSVPHNTSDDWLPAYVVYGEGIFLKFNPELLHDWEQRINVNTRIQPLAERYRHLLNNRRTREKQIIPRFVMAHTFAHLLMNQLTFECGYSSSSLRERLYISNDESKPMYGVLIYTAAGDSDGTMGGLVRMGKPGYLEQVIRKSLLNAGWCSADPICSEIEAQGPDSCNMAACHSCSLVPETACEEFNRFLDRGLTVGLPGMREIAYFS
ncbi:DrmB family protein [Paenibacillus glycanilyticus]|uniref:DrmB family protein n=1 Tax=Paenibacillus glycanilyticus TaxID=126569 RepID=UPI003EBA42E8